MHHRVSSSESGWLEVACNYLRDSGYVVIEQVLSADGLAAAEIALARAHDGLRAELGPQRWQHALGAGYDELRLPMRFDPLFLRLLETGPMLALIDAVLSPQAVLRFQNGMFSPPGATSQILNQQRFHMNFRRVVGGMVALDVVFAVSDFDERCGTLVIVPGSHQRPDAPAEAYLRHAGRAVDIPRGAMLVMDATLWHHDQPNHSAQPRLGIDHQFVLPFMKQHIDYVRALGPDRLAALPDRVRQLLGCYTRVPASLDEFYVPASERGYRADQW